MDVQYYRKWVPYYNLNLTNGSREGRGRHDHPCYLARGPIDELEVSQSQFGAVHSQVIRQLCRFAGRAVFVWLSVAIWGEFGRVW